MSYTRQFLFRVLVTPVLMIFLLINIYQNPYVSKLTRTSPKFAPVGSQLDFNASAWLFASVHNTFRILGQSLSHNGVSFVPTTVAPGTLLYHGKINPSPPPTTEWLALDPEYSLSMIHGPFSSQNDSYLLTYRTVKQLNLINVDGASASLYPFGTMDSQGAVLRMNKTDWVEFREYERAHEWCKWIQPLGLDGVVRLNTGFEIILCSFTNPKVELIDTRNVKSYTQLHRELNQTEDMEELAPLDLLALSRSDNPGNELPPHRPLPPSGPPRRRGPQSTMALWSWTQSGIKKYFGDSRLVPDFRGFVSFYGRDGLNVTGPMNKHRLLHTPSSVAEEVRSDLEQAMIFTDWNRKQSKNAINWQAVSDTVANGFTTTLNAVNYTLSSVIQATTDQSEVNVINSKGLVDAAETVLTMFFDRADEDKTTLGLARCKAGWIPSAGSSATVLELRIEQAFQQVVSRLCDVTFRAYELGIHAQTDGKLTHVNDAIELKKDVEEVISTLAWPEFRKCRTGCQDDEVCYFPMWPSCDVSDEDYDIGMRCIKRDDIKFGRKIHDDKEKWE